MADSSITSLDKVGAFGSLGFGVFAVAAPKAFLHGYGLDAGSSTRVFARLWGTRNIVIGALALTNDSASDRTRLRQATLALNALDSVLIATADGVASSSRIRGALTTGSFAAIAAVRIAQD